MIRLKAGDGHELDAYVEEPVGTPRGGIVVVQEIFGITDHIKRVVHEYAAAGYHAIAPALFDRVKRGIVLPYTEVQAGRAYMSELQWPSTLADVDAAIAHVRAAGGCAVVGFCWGGTVAHVAASDLTIDAAISYYGGGVAKMLDKRPKCPIMYHFGDQDQAIPVADIDKINKAQAHAVVHVYPGAGHGFNCEDRHSFSASDARLAFGRSLLFVREQVAKTGHL
jgi:carboxymethylenebutenolidase